MEKKYEFTGKETVSMFDGKEFVMRQIRALKDIPLHGVEAGDIGGFVSAQSNLSQEGNCWLGEKSSLYGDSNVSGDVSIMESRLYNTSISGSGKIHYSQVYHSQLMDTDFTVFNCSISKCRSQEKSFLRADSSALEKVSIHHSKVMVKESRVKLMGDTELTIMLGGKSIEIDDSELLVKTNHPDEARIHGETKVIGVNTITPLKQFTAFEGLVLEHVTCQNVELFLGRFRGENGDSCTKFLGSELNKLELSDVKLQAINSILQGNVVVKGNLFFEDSKILDAATVINQEESYLTLTEVVVEDVAYLNKDCSKMVHLKNCTYQTDDTHVITN